MMFAVSWIPCGHVNSDLTIGVDHAPISLLIRTRNSLEPDLVSRVLLEVCMSLSTHFQHLRASGGLYASLTQCAFVSPPPHCPVSISLG